MEASTQRRTRMTLGHIEMLRGENGWTVAATYSSEAATLVVEKEHKEYGAAVASLVNETPDTIEVHLAP